MRPGELVGGRYLIEAEAGRGGMSAIYRARDQRSGDTVALKVLARADARDADRFELEVSLLAELRHPGIIALLDRGTVDGAGPYLVLEWVSGEDLASRLEREPLALGEALELVAAAADALAVAHARGVVHRDVKPSNLLLVDGSPSRVKLIDFGVALDNRDFRVQTLGGVVIGTPQYMAPEQARGARLVDPRADVFSLGAVLYECITGQQAFHSETLTGLLAQIILHEPTPAHELVAGVPRTLGLLIARMLAKQPENRPADGAEVALALRDIAEDLGAELSTISGLHRRSDTFTGPELRVLSVVLLDHLPQAPTRTDGDAPTVAGASFVDVDEQLLQIARRFDARVDPLVDGSVLVTAGGSGLPTDQARRAAGCALALRRGFAGVPMALATGRGVPGAKIPTGQVIERAADQLAAARRAARSGRPDDRIQVDEVTVGLLDERFAVAGDGDGLYLVGEHEVEVTRTLLGRPTPFVGRQGELGLLEATFAQCVEELVARAVLIEGPPGIGKSRLRYEFLRRLRERPEPVGILIARGEPLGAHAPFALLGPALRRLAGVIDGEPLEAQRRKLRARLGRHLAADRLPTVAAFLGEVVGIIADDAPGLAEARRDPRLMGDRMQAAWEEWLQAECSSAPLVVILEDLHWGDLPSVRFIDAALRNLQDCPFLVVAFARTGDEPHLTELWRQRRVQRIQLGRLSERAERRLVEAVLGGGADQATVARVVGLADGNAFYLEELIRAVASGARELPDTVIGMAQSRLDAVGDRGRQVLRAASVFGERFWRGGVSALVGERIADVDGALRELAAQELITRRPTPTLPDEQEYVFRHALIREAAYATLADKDRARGHRLAGDWLEPFTRAGDPARGEELSRVFAAELAAHFARGDQPERAAVWYVRGARLALAGNDFAGAVASVHRAAECAAAGDLLGAARLIQAEAASWQGDWAGAERAAAAAAEHLARGTTDWFRAVAEAIEAACHRGDHKSARAWAREASAIDAGAGAVDDQIICLCRGALRLSFAGRFQLAEELIRHIERIAPDVARLGDQAAARCHELSALRAYFAGDPAGNLRGLEAAHRHHQRAGSTRNQCQTAVWLGFAYIELGDCVLAERQLRQALSAAERLGLGQVTANALENLSLALARQDRLSEADSCAGRALAMFEASGEPRKQASSHLYLAEIALRQGDPGRSIREAMRALELSAAAPPQRAGALADLARALLVDRRIEEARAAAAEAIGLIEAGAASDAGESAVRLVWAECLHAAGETAVARAAIITAAGRLEERAARIADPAWRAKFLEGVPDHARTIELARTWTSGVTLGG
ncbi:MAG TPA: protein kinase [Kofleriaceae bacterium]|nr:protein kinase [Kofleriaceae bacterium]